MKGQNSTSRLYFVPNIVTTTGLLCGLISIIFAMQCNDCFAGLSGTQWAWIFMGGALICDYLDGMCARIFHAYSELGKNLDSLSDLVSFGVAPALLLFKIMEVNDPGWSFVTWLPLLIPITGAYRLARFNIDPNQKNVFMGLPIPANAIFCAGLSSMLLQPEMLPAWVTTFALLATAFLMVSPMPMFSLKIKNFNPSVDNVLRLILLLATVALVLTLKMQGLVWVVIVYLFLSFISFYALSKEN